MYWCDGPQNERERRSDCSEMDWVERRYGDGGNVAQESRVRCLSWWRRRWRSGLLVDSVFGVWHMSHGCQGAQHHAAAGVIACCAGCQWMRHTRCQSHIVDLGRAHFARAEQYAIRMSPQCCYAQKERYGSRHVPLIVWAPDND